MNELTTTLQELKEETDNLVKVMRNTLDTATKVVSSFQDMAQREVNAGDNFVQLVCEQFNTTPEEAEKVLRVFRKAKAVMLNRAMGRYDLTHGAFWNKTVIRRAIAAEE